MPNRSFRDGECRATRTLDGFESEGLLASLQVYLDYRASGGESDRHTVGAWARFFALANPLVRRIASSPGGSRADVENKVQDVWIAILSRFPRIRGRTRRDNLARLLAVIARHAISDYHRSPSRRLLPSLDPADAATLPGRESSPLRVVERRETCREVRSRLKELRRQNSEAAFRLMHLRWIEGKDYEEIAAVLDCTAKQVRDRHRRGLLTLRSIIRDSTDSNCRGHARAN
jgi:RNA polymerase sigma factor (sigma-70 family)